MVGGWRSEAANWHAQQRAVPQWRETIPFEATPELLTALFGHVESIATHRLDLRLDAARSACFPCMLTQGTGACVTFLLRLSRNKEKHRSGYVCVTVYESTIWRAGFEFAPVTGKGAARRAHAGGGTDGKGVTTQIRQQSSLQLPSLT